MKSARKAQFLLFLIRFMAKILNKKLVCIALTEHLGDIVAGEPISRAVKEMNGPNTWVIWITARRYSELPRLFPKIDWVIHVCNLGAWICLKSRLSEYVIYDLHLDNRWCGQTHWSLKNETANPEINDKNYYLHVNLLGLECANAGLHWIHDQPCLPRLETGLIRRLGLQNERFIVVHVRSNERDREWADEKWRDLVYRLYAASGFPIVEVGLSAPACHYNSDYCTSTVGKLSLSQLCELISECRAFIGVDSGPAHIANAYMRPAVILMGKYRIFSSYMPFSGWLESGGQNGIVRADGLLKELSTDVVMKTAMQVLSQ